MTNRLQNQTSPYLLQHAGNPVDWYPWGDEALAAARERDVPMLLSVGYAACHWCHVMAHESFEDAATAELMNERFVCVKVDREERPDIDAIYMDAVQAMTGSGGWPMTVFATPEGKPFYAGTYFPKEPRYGMPSFGQVLKAIARAWDEDRDHVTDQAAQVIRAISAVRGDPGGTLDQEMLAQAHAALRHTFDAEWAGWGSAPKFPQAMLIGFCLRSHRRTRPGALDMARATLDAMARGGIYDQLGGGFHRYSTDRLWLVPHFEKMLYDNAQLALVYAQAFQATRHDSCARVARETLDYLLREMRHERGGFFSSQDADSEGVEGKFFTWSWSELVEAAGENVARWFGATPDGNWEESNILWTPRPLDTVAGECGISPERLSRQIEGGRAALFERRQVRVHPGTDDKIVAAWNGLAIQALAVAGRALDAPRYVAAAEAAAAFVLGDMRLGGRLQRSWRDGRCSGPGFSDDYALVAAGLLALFEATGDARWIRESRSLADALLRLFEDPNGGFFQTGSDAERLVVRPKEVVDSAVPSGNSAAAHLLIRLSMLTGEGRYEDAAVRALRVVASDAPGMPSGFGEALQAIDLLHSHRTGIAIAGDPADSRTLELAREVWSRFLPHAVLAIGAVTQPPAVPLLENRSLVDGHPAAYVCENFTCRRPATSAAELAALLQGDIG